MNKIYYNGIDTSKWQASKVDYAKAKKNGIDFAILRIGYNQTLDKCFEADYASVVASGLKVGVYFYTIATTVADAKKDATRVLGWLNNRHLDFPIFYDMEDAVLKGTSRKSINSDMYNEFKNTIENYGVYDVALYSGEYFYNTYFDKTKIDDDLWIAKYSTKEPNVGRDITIWQYSSDAINTQYYIGKLDRNYMLAETFNGSKSKKPKKSSNPYPIPTRTLKKTIPCMKGNDVKWLQYELGFNGKDLDGIFGKDTKNAVLAYQKKFGLKEDGIVGSATRYCMIND